MTATHDPAGNALAAISALRTEPLASGQKDATQKPKTPLYLEDLKIGRRFSSRTAEVGRPAVLSFAEQFDPQPFHLDDDLAKSSVFRGLAASGWHTASVTMGLIVDSVPLQAGWSASRSR